MGDPLARWLIALGFEPFPFLVSLALAIMGTALAAVLLDALPRGRFWAIGFLIVGGSLVLANDVRAQRPQPGVVIVCASGGVTRLNESGFLASGAECVLHDKQGGESSADSILVYDSALGSP